MIHGSRARRLSAVTFAVALVTLAAACSSSKKAAPAASSAAPTTSAAAPATSAAPATTSAAAPATSAAAAPTSAAAGSGAPANIKKGLVVYFIPKDTQNPYEVIADKGGAAALAELGGKVVVSSGTADTAAAQIPSIQAAI
ncbi:MAG TPA: hypothetical protein VGD55_02160, partial [Acidothermaceae bacterium]